MLLQEAFCRELPGHNLFVSAYHGFATLGDEHIPEPHRFVKFPPFAVQLQDAAKVGGSLVIPAVVTIHPGLDAGRYRLLLKVQLTAPGKGRDNGKMQNYLADANCGSGAVNVIIPDYVDTFGLNLDEYQVHAQAILLDTVTGYRSQAQLLSKCLSAGPVPPTAG